MDSNQPVSTPQPAAGPIAPFVPVVAPDALAAAVGAILGQARREAKKRTGSAALALAMIGALAFLRRQVDGEAGYAALRQFDDFLRGRLLELDFCRPALGARARPILPDPKLSHPSADAIVLDAARSTLLLNRFGPANEALLTAAAVLLGLLADELDGVPDWCALSERMDAAPESPALAHRAAMA